MRPAPGRILIVEDDVILAANLNDFLAHRYHEVRVATDARGAATILNGYVPDAVVIDFGLPEVDGIRTYLDVVQRHAPQAGCVLISGHLSEHMTRVASNYGIHHLLIKPFSLAELLATLERCLDGVARIRPPDGSKQENLVSPYPERRGDGNRQREERRISPGRRHHDRSGAQGGRQSVRTSSPPHPSRSRKR